MAAADSALPPIAILGAGSMGGAIARGLSRSGLAAGGVTTTNRSRAKAAELDGLVGVSSIALEEHPTGNTDAAAARPERDRPRAIAPPIEPAPRIAMGGRAGVSVIPPS